MHRASCILVGWGPRGRWRTANGTAGEPRCAARDILGLGMSFAVARAYQRQSGAGALFYAGMRPVAPIVPLGLRVWRRLGWVCGADPRAPRSSARLQSATMASTARLSILGRCLSLLATIPSACLCSACETLVHSSLQCTDRTALRDLQHSRFRSTGAKTERRTSGQFIRSCPVVTNLQIWDPLAQCVISPHDHPGHGLVTDIHAAKLAG